MSRSRPISLGRSQVAIAAANGVPVSRPLLAAYSSLVLLAALVVPGGSAGAQTAPSLRHPVMSAAVRTSTLGLGVEAGALLSRHVGVRLGASWMRLGIPATEASDLTLEGRVRSSSLSALVDLYPGSESGFRFTAGALVGSPRVAATGVPSGGSFDVNDNQYSAEDVGTLEGEVRFPRVMPYVGIGFGRRLSRGLGIEWLSDIGVAIGRPTLSLRASGQGANAQLAADVEAERARLEADARRYVRVLPVISTGLAFRF